MNSESYSQFLAQLGVTLVKGRTANCDDPEPCRWTILLPGPFGWEWGFSSLSALDNCLKWMTYKQLPLHNAVVRFREMCLEADGPMRDAIADWMRYASAHGITEPLDAELKEIAGTSSKLPRHWRSLAVSLLPPLLGKTPQFLFVQLRWAYLSLDSHIYHWIAIFSLVFLRLPNRHLA